MRWRPSTVALTVVAATGVVLGVVLRLAGGATAASWVDDYTVPQLLNVVTYGAAAVMVLTHRRGHNLGRLFALTTVLQAMALVASGWMELSDPDPATMLADASAATVAAALVEGVAWIPAVLPIPALLPLLVPDGRLPSPRWRWHVAAVGAIVGGLVAVFALVLTTGDVAVLDAVQNSTIEDPRLDVAQPLLFGPYLVLVVAAVAGLAGRYRRTHGEDRQRLRGMLVIIGLAALLSAVAVPLSQTAPVLRVVSAVPLAALPVALAVAVVRHGWLDIELVISRALTAGLLVVFVALAYVVVVVGVGAVLAGDGDREVLALATTGVVAIAFHPVRIRLERLARRLVYGERITPYEVLAGYALDRDGDDVLLRATRLVHDALGAEVVSVWRAEDHAPPVTWPPLHEPSPRRADEHRVVAPVVHRGVTLGAVSLTKQPGERVSDGDRRLVDDLASALGRVLVNHRLTDELRRRVAELTASRERLVGAGDAARREIEQALDTSSRRRLLDVRAGLADVATVAAERGADRVAGLVAQLGNDVVRADRAVVDFARGVYPPQLESGGLVAALRESADRSPVPVEVRGDPGPMPRAVAATVWFVALEALQNVAKYAAADRVVVSLDRDGDALLLRVEDDGDGFDMATTTGGGGFANMHDRVDAFGGTIDVVGVPGRGTVVTARVPVPVAVV